MRAFFAARALLPSGWAHDIRLDVEPTGIIAAVNADASRAGSERLAGPVLPGLVNLHCHAFQRAMAGLAESGGDARANFWGWRDRMYGLAARLTPEAIEAIAAQCYVELLKGGFTSVCEFHYLHNDPAGQPYANPAETSERIIAAATTTGVGLTLLPVLYMTSDFGGAALKPEQRRFAGSPDRLLQTVERLSAAHPHTRFGIAPHSLRAVPPPALAECMRAMDRFDVTAPIHIHVAEQTKEVDDCLAWSGRRPVEWLLEHHALSKRWCLVHATHTNDDEIDALARSGSVAGLCPTTEANLGDGLFPLARYLASQGTFGIGSDSNISVSAIEELRWLEYGQRLAHRRRAIAATETTPSTGLALYQAAAAGGARASGRPTAGLAPGERADFLVLDSNSPFLVDKKDETLIDALIFAGNANPIRDVFVGGERIVAEGRHRNEEAIFRDFRRALAGLGES
jgi:formimidoylglutamate deiminase